MSADNGGPAFPKAGIDPWGKAHSVHTGMSLRDYFAAKAMQGMLSRQEAPSCGGKAGNIAEMAYIHADAMLAEREKP